MSKRVFARAAALLGAATLAAGVLAVVASPAQAASLGEVTLSQQSGSVNDTPIFASATSPACPTGYGENAEIQLERLQAIQREIHDTFIALVKESRGTRLKGEDDYLFTGEYWAGERSVKLGLVDGIGDLRDVLRARYGDKVQTPLIAPAAGLLSGMMGRKPGAGSLLGWTSGPEELISAIEARALWARYGL